MPEGECIVSSSNFPMAKFTAFELGSNSFRRNDDPLICIDEEKFCVDKIRLGVLTSTSCVSHLCVNNRQMKNVKTNLFNFSRTVFTFDTKQKRL